MRQIEDQHPKRSVGERQRAKISDYIEANY